MSADRLAAYNKRRNAVAKPTDPRVDVGARALYEAEGNERTYEEFKEKQRHLSEVYTEEVQIMLDAIDKAAIITTGEVLAQLPEGSVIRFFDIMPQVAEKNDEGTWMSACGFRYQDWEDTEPTPVPFPATLLYRPAP